MSDIWLDLPASRELAENQIVIWKTLLERQASDLVKLKETLSADEHERASRFYFQRDRDHFVIARGVLRTLLGRYVNAAPSDVRFRYGAQLKPSLDADAPSVSFNISHTQNLAVFAFARNRRLGVDVEKIRSDFKVADIATRYFSERECRELFSLPAGQQSESFFFCWTRKEAYLKARGEGLHLPLDSFSVSLAPSQPAIFREGVDAIWQIRSFSASEQFPAAVVYDGPSAEFTFLAIE